MKRYEKEVEQRLLSNEKEVLKELERQYTTSLKDVKKEIAVLTRKEQTKSVVYQLHYQQAVEDQISSILGTLKTKNIDTIDEYLRLMYTDGFVGTNYSLMRQRIPLLIPINQDAMIASVTKHIAGMTFAERIGVHMDDFKLTIKDEITRGLASNMTYTQVAVNVSRATEESLYKAYRIARTEGQRVANEAKWHNMREAEQRGASIVREWCSTLDGSTRATHQELDGQLRGVEEPFSGSAGQAMYPGGFSSVAENVHCRCIVLQRATWALSDEARLRMAKIDGVSQLIKVKNYEDFKAGHYQLAR